MLTTQQNINLTGLKCSSFWQVTPRELPKNLNLKNLEIAQSYSESDTINKVERGRHKTCEALVV